MSKNQESYTDKNGVEWRYDPMRGYHVPTGKLLASKKLKGTLKNDESAQVEYKIEFDLK